MVKYTFRFTKSFHRNIDENPLINLLIFNTRELMILPMISSHPLIALSELPAISDLGTAFLLTAIHLRNDYYGFIFTSFEKFKNYTRVTVGKQIQFKRALVKVSKIQEVFIVCKGFHDD